MSSKLVEINCFVKHETENAMLISSTDLHAKDAWIPKSKIDDYCESASGTIESIFIPEWLAIEKELV